jgi:putative oxidoreductase
MDFKQFLLSSPQYLNLGLAFIRFSVGIIFTIHGGLKFYQGKEELLWTGQQMKNLGITFFPLFWGICAGLAEGLGGFLLAIGLFAKIDALFIAFTMFVAMTMHYKKGDPWGYISHPLLVCMMMIGFMIAGPGRYSLDYLLFYPAL